MPLYYQLQELLHQQIASGRFTVGDALPSEGELCRLFGVSRIVVRQALEVLEDDGEIIRQQGKGTFVAEPKVDLIAGGLVRVLSVGEARQRTRSRSSTRTTRRSSRASRRGSA